MMFDVAVETHPRLTALSHNARALYLNCLCDANDSGWLALRGVLTCMITFGAAPLVELGRAGLATETTAPDGVRFHLPETLDQAAALAAGAVP